MGGFNESKCNQVQIRLLFRSRESLIWNLERPLIPYKLMKPPSNQRRGKKTQLWTCFMKTHRTSVSLYPRAFAAVTFTFSSKQHWIFFFSLNKPHWEKIAIEIFVQLFNLYYSVQLENQRWSVLWQDIILFHTCIEQQILIMYVCISIDLSICLR